MLKILDENATCYQDLSEFVSDLALFADKWVDDKAEEIMASARELYEDKTLRIILKMWVSASETYRKRRLDALLGAAAIDDYWHPDLSSCQYEDRRAASYADVLRELLLED